MNRDQRPDITVKDEKSRITKMYFIPATFDPTSAVHQIAFGTSSAGAYGPYLE